MSNYKIVNVENDSVQGEFETYEDAAAVIDQYLDEEHFQIHPRAIDPGTCGCLACMRGETVPLEYATEAHLIDLLRGLLLSDMGSVRVGVNVSVRMNIESGYAAKTVTASVGIREFEVPEHYAVEVLRRFGL